MKINYRRFTYTSGLLAVDQTGDLCLHEDLEQKSNAIEEIWEEIGGDLENITDAGEELKLTNEQALKIKKILEEA